MAEIKELEDSEGVPEDEPRESACVEWRRDREGFIMGLGRGYGDVGITAATTNIARSKGASRKS